MEQIDFEKIAESLVQIGAMPSLPKDSLVYTGINDARNVLLRGLMWATKGNSKWLPEYDHVADWMNMNEGRGLLMFGDCGRGKSLIGKYIMPVIFSHYMKKIMNVYSAQYFNQNIDEVLQNKIVYIDDIGTEEISNQYGNKRVAFSELVDVAEANGNLIVVSTNLSLDSLTTKYGLRTTDRLKAITKQVLFKGESLRK